MNTLKGSFQMGCYSSITLDSDVPDDEETEEEYELRTDLEAQERDSYNEDE